jgi:phage-related protein
MAAWKQKNGELPFQDWPDIPKEKEYPSAIWKQSEGILPYKSWPDVPKEKEYPSAMWKQVAGELPYKKWPTFYNVIPWIKQRNYITVHDMMTDQRLFSRNGERILHPTSCTITEELNGTYEVAMEHPIDKEGNWKQLVEFNILKVQNQLFTIDDITHSFEGNEGKVTLTASHIFYQQADGYVFDKDRDVKIKIDEKTVKKALDSVYTHTVQFKGQPGETINLFNFQWESDINKPYFLETEGKNPVDVIMGTEDSILNACGGELYRDNFYFSLKERMEGALDNAFDIRVGLNLIGIERHVDVREAATWLSFDDKFGNHISLSYVPEGVRFPHHVVRKVKFNYDEDIGYEAFREMAYAFFRENCYPLITYTIKVEDLRQNPDFADYKFFRLKVGDTGRVYDKRLGINITAEIIRTVTDGITGKVIEVTLGNIAKSLTRPSRMANIISRGTASDKLNDKIQEDIKDTNLKLIVDWESAGKFTWQEMKQFRWEELYNE